VGKIHSMMDIGKRAMMNNQTSLQTVSHNIANKNVDGYSRQRVEQVSAVPIIEGRNQIGQGTKTAAVTRVNHSFIEKQIEKEGGGLGFQKGRTDSLDRVEQLFNEQNGKGLSFHLSEFFNSFRDLATNPESVSARTMVREKGSSLAQQFKSTHDGLTQVQRDSDHVIQSHVNEVNSMLTEVASLNEQVATAELQPGVQANDQRDRRELLLKKISEKMDINWAENNIGEVTVSTAGTGILVSGYNAYPLEAQVDPASGKMEIFYRSNPQASYIKVSDRIKGGEIAGALSVRDKSVENAKDFLNNIARTLADEMNAIHVNGFGLNNQTGLNFFEYDNENPAMNLRLNSVVADDITAIATASKQNARGDNAVANVISNLQFRNVMSEGTATIDEYFNSQVALVGIETQRAKSSFENQKNIVDQLKNIRESISGVSLDEEATKMIEFQRAFDASARVIKTADEMFDTVLNLKRL